MNEHKIEDNLVVLLQRVQREARHLFFFNLRILLGFAQDELFCMF
jgi:hypothetical protein